MLHSCKLRMCRKRTCEGALVHGLLLRSVGKPVRMDLLEERLEGLLHLLRIGSDQVP